MPLYYFHVVYPDQSRDDDADGVVFRGPKQARAEAVTAARSLMADAIRNGYDISDQSFEVADEAGTVIVALRFTDAVVRGRRPQWCQLNRDRQGMDEAGKPPSIPTDR